MFFAESIIFISFFLLQIEVIVYVHLFDDTFRPDAFIVICLEHWPRWHKPPEEICAERELRTREKVVLLAELFLDLVDETLVVLDGADLLLEQLKRNIGCTTAQDKDQTSSYEG